MGKKVLTRKELYDLLCSIPLSTLAKKFEISDNGLRKICKRMNIPLPPNGHWQKVRYGKFMSRMEFADTKIKNLNRFIIILREISPYR